jgi:hypothetical protein
LQAVFSTPKQDSLKTQIEDLQSVVNGLYKQRNLGLGKDDKLSIEKYEKKLGKVKKNQENQQKFRERRKCVNEVGRPTVTDNNILIESITTDIVLWQALQQMTEESRK